MGIPRPKFDYPNADGFGTVNDIIREVKISGETYPCVREFADGRTYVGVGSAAPASKWDYVAADVTLADAVQASTTLTLPVRASTLYFVECEVFFDSPSADDLDLKVAGPSGATSKLRALALAQGATVATGDVLGPQVVEQILGTALWIGAVGGSTVWGGFRGLVLTDTTAGSITVTAAKHADASTDASLKKFSYLKVEPV